MRANAFNIIINAVNMPSIKVTMITVANVLSEMNIGSSFGKLVSISASQLVSQKRACFLLTS